MVYSEVLAAVRDLYPQISEDARTGVIRTAWHPVHVQQGTDDGGGQPSPNPNQVRTGLETTNQLRQQFFIRFDVHVVGGRPWRVRVDGEASSWKAGEIPTPLRGPEIPHWLEGRVNALEVAIHDRLRRYAVALKDGPGRAGESAPAARPLDVARFGALPAGAAQVVAEVDRAAGARDVARLRALMADDFTYSTGDPPSADTAIIMWRADPSILAELGKALDAGCAADPGGQVVCPAAAIGDAAFAGYRAGFKSLDGRWKMVFLVAGD